MPTRAHRWDAGLDLYTPVDVTVPGSSWADDNPGVELGAVIIDTGVHIGLGHRFVGMVKSKSGLNANNDLFTEGVIDAEYTGSIKVKIHNAGAEPYHFSAGEKIAQLVILRCRRPKLKAVGHLKKTKRGANGFGSTGR